MVTRAALCALLLAAPAAANGLPTSAAHVVAVAPTPFPLLGGAEAPVVIEIYFAFAHPSSSSALSLAIRAAQRHGDVQLRFHLVEAGSDAGAEAALEAMAQNRFWPFMQRWVAQRIHQSNNETLERVGGAAGLDVEALHAALASGRHRELAAHLAATARARRRVPGDLTVAGVRCSAWAGDRGIDELIAQARPRALADRDGIVTFAELYQRPRREREEPFVADLGAEHPIARGSKFAAVTVTLLTDLACPRCCEQLRQVARLREKPGNTLLLRQVWKPLLPATASRLSRSVSEVALAAQEQGKFWPFFDRITERCSTADTTALGFEDFERALSEAGIDTDLALRRIEEGTYKTLLSAEYYELRRRGLTYSPSLLIGGEWLIGVPTLEALERAFEKGLDRGIRERLGRPGASAR